MKKYTLFLASSAELNNDKLFFENFISKKNKEWHRHKVFLELLTWKDFTDAIIKERTQNKYNRAIQKSDIFIVLFHTKMGRYTKEEFEQAYKQFKKNKGKKPLIFTYFRNDGSEPIESIEEFKAKLDNLGHFYTLYKNTEDLNYKFNMQLERLASENFIKWDTFNWSKTLRYALFYFLLPILALSFVYQFLKLKEPINITVMVDDINKTENLTFKEGQLTLIYGDKLEQIKITKEAVFEEIPASFRGYKAKLKFSAYGYETIDTLIKLNDSRIDLSILRDNSLGKIFGSVKGEDGEPIQGVNINVLNIYTQSNSDGSFELLIPLKQQKQFQRLKASKNGYITYDKTLPVFPDVSAELILKKND